MSKAKMQAARELIKEKRYNEARALLNTIDHPKAKEWLERLPSSPQRAGLKPGTTSQGGGKRRPLAIILVILAALVLFVMVPQLQNFNRQYREVFVAEQTFVATGAGATSILQTATPFVTATQTPTATITQTPTLPAPSITPDPEATVGDIVLAEIGRVRTVEMVNVDGSMEPKILAVQYAMAEGFGGYDVDFTEREMARVVCALRAGGFAEYRIQLSAMINVSDAAGNITRIDGVSVRVAADVQMNCANVDLIRLSELAETWLVDPVLTR